MHNIYSTVHVLHIGFCPMLFLLFTFANSFVLFLEFAQMQLDGNRYYYPVVNSPADKGEKGKKKTQWQIFPCMQYKHVIDTIIYHMTLKKVYLFCQDIIDTV